LAMQCRKQANSMMRQAQKMLGLLLEMQAFRQKRDADPKSRERAAQAQRSALALMTQALLQQPAPTAITEPSSSPSPARPKPGAAEQHRSDHITIDPRKTTVIRDSQGRLSIIMPEQPGIH
jgi:hypothetical protein